MQQSVTVTKDAYTVNIRDPESSLWKEFLDENRFPLLMDLGVSELAMLDELLMCRIDNFPPGGFTIHSSNEFPPICHFTMKNKEDKQKFIFMESTISGWYLEDRSRKPRPKPERDATVLAFGPSPVSDYLVMTRFSAFLRLQLQQCAPI